MIKREIVTDNQTLRFRPADTGQEKYIGSYIRRCKASVRRCLSIFSAPEHGFSSSGPRRPAGYGRKIGFLSLTPAGVIPVQPSACCPDPCAQSI